MSSPRIERVRIKLTGKKKKKRFNGKMKMIFRGKNVRSIFDKNQQQNNHFRLFQFVRFSFVYVFRRRSIIWFKMHRNWFCILISAIFSVAFFSIFCRLWYCWCCRPSKQFTHWQWLNRSILYAKTKSSTQKLLAIKSGDFPPSLFFFNLPFQIEQTVNKTA